MILDSCHSGAVPGREFRPGPLGDPGFWQLSYDKGMQILSASQPAQTKKQGEWVTGGEGRTLLVEALETVAQQNPGQKLGQWLHGVKEQLPRTAQQLYPRLKEAAKSSGNEKGGAGSGSLKQFSDAARPFFGIWTKPAIALYVGNILVRRAAGVDQAANDIVGACPVGAMATLTNAAGQHVFVYRFDRSIPGKGQGELGAFHSLEIPYVFGTLRDSNLAMAAIYS